MDKISLVATARTQLELAGRATNGRSATTVYGGHAHLLRQTLIAMTSGTALDEHESPGEATVHVIVGRVVLRAGEHAWEGSAGDLVVVPDATHSLTALEDAAVLLTVAKPV
jgi:quercetin dioxygenase-like cupin family protein